MVRKKLVQIMTAAAIMAAVAGGVPSSQMVSAKTQTETKKAEEEAALFCVQKNKSNQLEIGLNISKHMNKSIASLAVNLQMDADTMEEVAIDWDSNLKSSQCKALYNSKTGILKLFIVDQKDLVKQGKVSLGNITIKSKKAEEIMTGMTLDGVTIVDLAHTKHELTLARETQYFTCYPSAAKPTPPVTKPSDPVTPAPTVPAPPVTRPSDPVTPAPTMKPTVDVTPAPGTSQKPVQVQKITLNKTKLTLTAGKKYTLKAQVLPANASQPKIRWMTSNAKTASVSMSGVVKGLKKGTVTITAASVDGSKVYAQATVKVTEVKPNKVKVSTSSLAMLPNEVKQVKASIAPANAANKKLIYTSSNKAVATVSKSGKITAKKPGKAIITITAEGNKKAAAAITVNVSKLIVNQAKVEVSRGKSVQLKARTAGKKKIQYISSNTKVAAVSNTGKITAKRKGTTTIKVKANGETRKVTVVVK